MSSVLTSVLTGLIIALLVLLNLIALLAGPAFAIRITPTTEPCVYAANNPSPLTTDRPGPCLVVEAPDSSAPNLNDGR